MFILGYIIIGLKCIQPLEKYLWVVIICRLNDILRNPLLTKFAFKVNDDNRHRNTELERERKRQLEIEDALKRRLERNAKAKRKYGFKTNCRWDKMQTTKL